METPDRGKYSTGPGTLIIHKKWANTNLHENLKVKFNAVTCRDINLYDFCLAGDRYVIFIPEAELVMCVRVEKLEKTSRSDVIVIGIRNTITADQYSRVQDMILKSYKHRLIPIGDASELPDLLFQLSIADSSFTPRKSPKPESCAQLNILLNIQGLGKLKSEKLISKFGTIHKIASSSVSELSSVLGFNLAAEVYDYFH